MPTVSLFACLQGAPGLFFRYPTLFTSTIISLLVGFVMEMGNPSRDGRSNLQLVCPLGRAASFNSD
jgi:hypothetical protein